MRPVIYNMIGSDIIQASDSLTIRSAILFGQEITTAGDIMCFVDFERFMNLSSMDKKLSANRFMQSILGITPDIPRDEEIQVLKTFKKIKNKSGEGIKIFKRWEKSTNEIHELLKKDTIEIFKKQGLINLKNLLKNDYWHVVTAQADNYEREDKQNYLTPVSQMMTLEKTFHPDLEPVDSSIPSIFFFQPEFICDVKSVFRSSERFKNLFQPLCKYKHKLFVLPNLNYATSEELSILRNFLSPLLHDFHLQIFEWLRKVKDSEAGAEDFLIQKVVPVCSAIQNQIDEHELKKYFRMIDKNKGTVVVTAGECMLTEIWDFYDSVNALPAQTKIVLNELKKQNNLDTRSQAFLVANYISVGKDLTLDDTCDLNQLKNTLILVKSRMLNKYCF